MQFAGIAIELQICGAKRKFSLSDRLLLLQTAWLLVYGSTTCEK